MGEIKETKKDKKARKAEKKKLKDEKKEVVENQKKSEENEEVAEESSKEDSGNESDNSDSESKHKDIDEIAIDLNASIPLSKKQQRLLKKGKLDLDKLAKKHPAPKPELTKEEQAVEDAKLKKSEFGVWIGNLTFDTTREDIVRFLTTKTSDFMDIADSTDDSDLIKITESDIVRFNLPKKERKIKGFAYVDFPTIKHVLTTVSLSEQPLNGRKLLIKNANSFEGRPSKDLSPLSKNPPSKILFVGNLSFDTTSELLEEHFAFCGVITRVRMATFEDTGKCKGFAFIDFKDETGPTNALKSKLAKKMINRLLRLEYGEDRSKRTPRRRDENGEIIPDRVAPSTSTSDLTIPSRSEPILAERSTERFSEDRPVNKRPRDDFRKPREYPQDNKRLKSSVALATAQRASAAIVPSSGKKIKFD